MPKKPYAGKPKTQHLQSAKFRSLIQMQLRPMDICMIVLVTLTQTFVTHWMSKLAKLHIHPVKGMKQNVSHIISICSAMYSGKYVLALE